MFKGIDWRRVWEVAKVVIPIILSAIAGGTAGHVCGGSAAEGVVKAHLTAEK